jgi:hypothetical protein
MKTLSQIEKEVNKLYNQLEMGLFFDTYHDTMYELVGQFDYLEDDGDDYKLAEEILEKCSAIIRAQKILLNVKIK